MLDMTGCSNELRFLSDTGAQLTGACAVQMAPDGSWRLEYLPCAWVHLQAAATTQWLCAVLRPGEGNVEQRICLLRDEAQGMVLPLVVVSQRRLRWHC